MKVKKGKLFVLALMLSCVLIPVINHQEVFANTRHNNTRTGTKSIYTPNSVVHKGKKITFSQSAYNYYETKGVPWDTLVSRCNNISREIKKKNVCVGPEFNGEDNLPSYILGHNPGTMSRIATLAVGDSIFVTDKNSKTFEYVVVDYANAEKSYNFVNGSGDLSDYFYYGGDKEAVLIQYCINHESHVYLALPKEEVKAENI